MPGICYALRPWRRRLLHAARCSAVYSACVLSTGLRERPASSPGVPSKGDPSRRDQGVGPRWLLIKNPRFGDVPSEPEYIWVEEDKVPTTHEDARVRQVQHHRARRRSWPSTVAAGRRPDQPAPEGALARATAPPRARRRPRSGPRAAAGAPAGHRRHGGGARRRPRPRGLRGHRPRRHRSHRQGRGAPGALVSLRRDRIPIVHPVTGELLGELDEELATGQGDRGARQVLGGRDPERRPRGRDQGQGSGRRPVTPPRPGPTPAREARRSRPCCKERVALVIGGRCAPSRRRSAARSARRSPSSRRWASSSPARAASAFGPSSS